MASNIFIDFLGPKVSGSSTQAGHETQIEVHSWNYGAHQPTNAVRSAAGGGTLEKVHHAPLTFTKAIDTASDDLLKACWTGQHFDKVELTAYRSVGDVGADNSGVQYLKITLDYVIVQDFSISGGQGDLPVESISLNYSKITFQYVPTTLTKGAAQGAQISFHDLSTNKAG